MSVVGTWVVSDELAATEVGYVAEDGVPVVTTLAEVAVNRVASGLPCRRVRSRAGARHYSGLFWSATNPGHVGYEGRLELNRLWLADFETEAVASTRPLRRLKPRCGNPNCANHFWSRPRWANGR